MTDVTMQVDGDGVAVITIDTDGQSMNVITEAFMDELEAAVDQILGDDAVKGAVISSGKSSGFMAGADLRMLSGLTERAKSVSTEDLFEGQVRLNRLLRKMETGGHSAKELGKGAKTKPFVAAVDGLALGGGFELVLACHRRIASTNPKIIFGLPEVQVGLLPGGGGTQRLPRILGFQGALQYLTTGKNMKAQEALGFGILHGVCEPDELVAKAKQEVLDNPKVVQPWDEKRFKYPGGGGAMHPNAVMTMMGASTIAQGQTYHNYPAVEAILSCVYEGSIVPMDTAVLIESKYFTKLIKGDVAGNMIRTLFVNKQAAEKGARRPKDVPPAKVKKLGMVGAGLMGAGITYCSAKAGMDVVLLDRDQDAADKGKAYSENLVNKDVKRKKLSQEKGDQLLARIHPTTDYEDLRGCDLIIEAVFESTEIKREVTQKVEAVVGPDTVFGSNTSTLPITDLQQNWSKPENFVGIHFFSPVEKMPLVEMIMGKDTGDKALAVALDYTRQIRKTPIVVNDSRGFYTSRCVGVYITEGHAMLQNGVVPALIENCGKMAGYPMGPLQLNDSVAIDLSVKIAKQTMSDLGQSLDDLDPWAKIPFTMSDEHGRHGMKNQKGFYDYDEGSVKPRALWPGLGDLFRVSEEQPSPAEVKTRLLYRQVVECARCFEEGVLTTPEDGDLGAIFGWGFGPFTGGPFSFMDTVGLDKFVAECDRLAQTYGDRFAPPQLLRDMAAQGRTFYGDAEAKKAA
ncbi:MAG: 3-hydroxyacyl-CoA dehydrogenase NAD-binding domain-containing protein [Pseudomonadota bacterium]